MTQPDVIEFALGVLGDAGLGSIAVRGGRFEPDDDPMVNPVVLLEEAGWLRETSIGLYNPFRLGITTFAVDERVAAQTYRLVTDVFHRLGPLVRNGVGLHRAYDETGPSPVEDPLTKWSARYGVVALYMADQVLV